MTQVEHIANISDSQLEAVYSTSETSKEKTFTFIETADGDRVTGYEFEKWLGYDLGTKFVPSKENKHIGHIDRTDNLNFPDGVQENDVISLHNGEYTRIQKVSRPMTVRKKDDYVSYGWWFVSDEIDTEREGWGDVGTSNKTALPYTGYYKK